MTIKTVVIGFFPYFCWLYTQEIHSNPHYLSGISPKKCGYLSGYLSGSSKNGLPKKRHLGYTENDTKILPHPHGEAQ
jgi:hypothetical protein